MRLQQFTSLLMARLNSIPKHQHPLNSKYIARIFAITDIAVEICGRRAAATFKSLYRERTATLVLFCNFVLLVRSRYNSRTSGELLPNRNFSC